MLPLNEAEVAALVVAANAALNEFHHKNACGCTPWAADRCINNIPRGNYDSPVFEPVMADLIKAYHDLPDRDRDDTVRARNFENTLKETRDRLRELLYDVNNSVS